MITEHSGRESIESIDQSGEAHEQNPETTISNGEVAGGEEGDVPGGAYNVPPELADEVSDEQALHERSNPDGTR